MNDCPAPASRPKARRLNGLQERWMVSRILTAMAQLGPAVAEQLKQSPLYQTYSRIAPNPENWPVPVTKMGNLLRKTSTDFLSISQGVIRRINRAENPTVPSRQQKRVCTEFQKIQGEMPCDS